MATYAELKAQAEELLRQAEELRKQQIDVVVKQVIDMAKENGVGIDELIERLSKQAGKAKGRRGGSSEKIIRYRGPNGEPWSGGPGRKPEWVRQILAAGGDLEQYRVA